MIEYTTHEVETETGKYYVRILAAERKTYTTEGGPGEDLIPRVQLSTDPKFGDDLTLDHVKVRGRKYAIEEYLTYNRTRKTWHFESSYRGSFRSAPQGKKVDFRAKTWDVLRVYVEEALAEFAKQYPDFERESIAQLFQYKVSHHQSKAESLRREARGRDAQADEWQARLDEMGK
ncbi:hypothetical protein [Streptomyces sp. BBFR102]|uniref:hypothetical protein n=1 Tax=Streptomyces sp. BBFR102 TaxID=3448171 RepID=UPI003F53E468